MKKLRLLSLAVASLFSLSLSITHAATFDDVQFWVGSGANQAAFVVDWNDGKSAESLLWGFRWNGTATGYDMFSAVVNADSRLFAHVGTFNFGTGPTAGIFGIGYDRNGSGSFGVSSSPTLSFGAGGLAVDSLAVGDNNVDPSGTPTDAGDHWLESWFPAPGYWGYYVKNSAGDGWTESFVGTSDRLLTDGAWDGYSFAAGYPGPLPGEPIAAVPEPTALALLSISALFLTCARRKH